MSRRGRSAWRVGTFLLVSLAAESARAQCCDGYSLASACDGVPLAKSRWCIQDSVPTGQAALPKEFCAYGDKVITTLEKTFNIPSPGVFEYELDSQTGGAHTGTACDHFGDGVAYDAFVGEAYGATGLWGYLLSLHEAINVWTGMASSGWPTDWWADHQSAFPNLMDFQIMAVLGTDNNDMNLLKAAAGQKKRFYPGGDSEDPKVVALDNVFKAMPGGNGFAGFSKQFQLQTADGVQWDDLGVPNPDVKRSEYVVAYMSLALGKSALPLLQGPGENGGGNICSNSPDASPGDEPYECSQAHVDALASAHCAIAANGKPAADLAALQAGKYEDVKSGPCGAACPPECACDASMHCVAPWLGMPVSGGGVAGGNSGGGTPAVGGGSSAAGGLNGGVGTGGGASGASNPSQDSGCSCTAAGHDDERGTFALLAVALAGGIFSVSRARRRHA